MIHVIATIQVADGSRDTFIEHFHQVMPQVHQENGCIEYGPAVDTPTDIGVQTKVGENTVIIIEKWDSVEALKAHLQAPHMLAYRSKVKNIVLSTTVNILSPA